MKLITYIKKKIRRNNNVLYAQKFNFTEEIINELLVFFYNEHKDKIILNEEDIIGEFSINERRELIREIQLVNFQTSNEETIQKTISKSIINYIKVISHRKKLLLCDYADIREKMLQRYSKDSQYDWNISYYFYYDETNNIRKLRVTDSKDAFIEGLNKFFVLGGICGEKENFFNIDDLFSELKLQKNLAEIKARHIYGKKAKDFKECLESKKLNKILTWIEKNDLYFHIIAFDNLNYIVDDVLSSFNIIDSGKRIVYGDLIYEYIKEDEYLFYSILKKYKYPAVNNNINFLNELIIYIKKMKKRKDKLGDSLKIIFYKQMIEELLEGINKKNNNRLLYGENTIISYEIYYQYNPILFYKSYHYFDEEGEIQKQLQDSIILYGREICNYEFINSKENRIVQLCDVIVSLFAKFFTSLDSIRKR